MLEEDVEAFSSTINGRLTTKIVVMEGNEPAMKHMLLYGTLSCIRAIPCSE